MTAPPLQALLFVLGAVALAGITHFLIWRRLLLVAQPPEVLKTAIPRIFIGLGMLFPLGMTQLLLMRHIPRSIAAPLMTTAFTWLGVVILLVLSLLLFEILSATVLPRHRRRLLSRLLLASALVFSVFGVIRANARPAVVPVHLTVPSALAGYRIVQLSDLHIGPTLGYNFAENVVADTNALSPDLIVITGDLVDGSVRELAPHVAPLAALRAKEGVLFVPGNHEYLSGIDDWVPHLESFGWRVLRNARLSLSRFDVIGADDFAGTGPGDFAWAQTSAAAERPSILIAHEPLVFVEACRIGLKAALAGHTHGGQLFPLGIWEWLVQGYVAGIYRCGETPLYVSSGTGYWGPPMRLGSRSEISLIEFVAR